MNRRHSRWQSDTHRTPTNRKSLVRKCLGPADGETYKVRTNGLECGLRRSEPRPVRKNRHGCDDGGDRRRRWRTPDTDEKPAQPSGPKALPAGGGRSLRAQPGSLFFVFGPKAGEPERKRAWRSDGGPAAKPRAGPGHRRTDLILIQPLAVFFRVSPPPGLFVCDLEKRRRAAFFLSSPGRGRPSTGTVTPAKFATTSRRGAFSGEVGSTPSLRGPPEPSSAGPKYWRLCRPPCRGGNPKRPAPNVKLCRRAAVESGPLRAGNAARIHFALSTGHARPYVVSACSCSRWGGVCMGAYPGCLYVKVL